MIRQNLKRFGKIMRPLNDLERGRTQNRVPLLLTVLYRPAFRRGSRRCPESVQRIRGLPHQHKTRLIHAAAALTAMVAPCFSPICSRQSRRERSA